MGRSGRKFRGSISSLSALLPHPEQGALSGRHIWQGCAHLLPLTTLASRRRRSPPTSHLMIIDPLTDLCLAHCPAQLWRKQGVKSLELRSSRLCCGLAGACHPTGRGGPSPPFGLPPHSLLPPSRLNMHITYWPQQDSCDRGGKKYSTCS